MNHYLFTFEDGSKAIAHYGVKGMKWGEWNDETKQRYGIDDGDELSKLRAFRETSYVLPKGSPVNRFTSIHEAKSGTDLSKPFYASTNEYDYNRYAEAAKTRDLPSNYERTLFGTSTLRSGLVKMSSVDDMTVARGEFVIDQMLKFGPGGNSLPVYDDPRVFDHFKKMGYDAIEDIEDQKLSRFQTTHPIIVLNGDKVQVDDSGTYWRKFPPKYQY